MNFIILLIIVLIWSACIGLNIHRLIDDSDLAYWFPDPILILIAISGPIGTILCVSILMVRGVKKMFRKKLKNKIAELETELSAQKRMISDLVEFKEMITRERNVKKELEKKGKLMKAIKDESLEFSDRLDTMRRYAKTYDNYHVSESFNEDSVVYTLYYKFIPSFYDRAPAEYREIYALEFPQKTKRKSNKRKKK